MHNAETVIERCLDSLCDQTIKNLEIIVIDDNSDDNSYEKASVYNSKCSKFMLLQNDERVDFKALKYNGLRYATGDFIGFLDAGDYVEKTYYEKMLNAIKKLDADIVCGDVTLAGSDPKSSYLSGANLNIKNDEEPIIITPVSAASDNKAPLMVAKLFRKSIVSICSENAYSDISFAFLVFANAKKIAYTPRNYYYRTNISMEYVGEESVSIEMAECLFRMATKILSDEKIPSELVKVMYGQNIWSILNTILSNQDNRERCLEECYDNLKFIEVLENNSYLDNTISVKSWGERRFILNIVRLFINKEFNEMTQLFDQHSHAPYYYLPRVSIVIPVYNGSNYLEAAIESALMQKYPNLEVIVVNDGSQDNGATENIARSFGDRIKYYYKENGGVASALNFGIEHMTGEYFSWLSHDDLYKNNKILKQIEALQDLEDKRTIVVCGYELVNENLEKLYDVNLRDLYTKEEVERPLFAVFRGGINGCGTLIHKSHFERVGMFNVDLLTTQDYDLWFRIMRGQKICYLAENYVLSRSHEAQDSKKLFDKHIMECNQLWIGLFEELRENEKQTISGTSLKFYMEEKRFFETLPYNDVVHYLDEKILESLKKSMEVKDDNTAKMLCSFFGIEQETFSLRTIKSIFYSRNKYAVILSEIAITNQVLLNNVDMLDHYLGNLISIIITNSRALETDNDSKMIFLSSQSLQIIPKLLYICGIELCIICDFGYFGQETLHLNCMEMGIRSVAWKLQKHWILNEIKYINECTAQIMEKRYADVTVWTDNESREIDAAIRGNAIFIPLLEVNEGKEYIGQCWKGVISQEYDKVVTERTELDFTKIANIISNFEKYILELDVMIKACPIDQRTNDDWEKRYNEIKNSTSWKLTKPIRLLADILKNKDYGST